MNYKLPLSLLILGMVVYSCTPNFDAVLDPSTPKANTVVNPYEGVDFTQSLRLKTNLHSHTTVSHGKQTASEMIVAYANHGFDVVAITDHDKAYIRPTEFLNVLGRDMLIIQGSEITMTHHFNSLFTEYGKTDGVTVESALRAEINKANSVLFLCHPGMHNWFYQMPWYWDIYQKFPKENLVGIEVINAKDEYPSDKIHWDRVLTGVAPHRNVYGFANDDAHSYSEIGFSYNEFFTEHFTIDEVRNAIVNGVSFFYSTSTVKNAQGALPYVNNITIDPELLTITVEAENFNRIDWICCGQVISNKNSISINAFAERNYNLGKYVRFVLTGKGGQLYSQPFLIK